MGLKKKSQTLTITCKFPDETTSISSKLKDLISQITSTLEQRTLYRWNIQHREAFMKSEPLSIIEKSTQTTALFYNNDNNQVVVEMVSLNMLNLVQFWDQLDKINPVEDNLHLPSKYKFTEQEIALIRKTYAIVTESSPANKWRTTTKVWGFKNDGLFNKGKKVLLGVMKPPEIPQQYQDQKLSQLPSPSGMVPLSVTTSAANVIADTAVPDVASPSLQLVEQIQTNFKFKTREAGIFYQTFESKTRAYIETISGISIDKLENPRSSKSSSNVMQTTLTLVGTKDQTRAAKDYLKTLQSSLTHMQTLFVNVSMQKYRQLHEMKLACEVSCSTANSDPLLEARIVSVRLKPPLNTRGLRKMEFPCDVWATVCGPDSIYVAEIHELLERLRHPFDSRITYINKTGLLNSIIQDNSTRKEFIEYYNLCGVRANEITKNGVEQIKLYVWSTNIDQRQDLRAILDQATKNDNSISDDNGSGIVTPGSDLLSSEPVSDEESNPSEYDTADDDTSYGSADSGLCYDFNCSNNQDKSSSVSKNSDSDLPVLQNKNAIGPDEKYARNSITGLLSEMTSQVVGSKSSEPSASLMQKRDESGQTNQDCLRKTTPDGIQDEDIHSFLAHVYMNGQNFGDSDIGNIIKGQIHRSQVDQNSKTTANLFNKLDHTVTSMTGAHGMHCDDENEEEAHDDDHIDKQYYHDH